MNSKPRVTTTNVAEHLSALKVIAYRWRAGKTENNNTHDGLDTDRHISGG